MRKIILALVLIQATIAATAFGQTGQTEPPKPQGEQLVDVYGNPVATLTPDGDKTRITDRYGNLQGFIGKDGVLTDRYGNVKGQLKK